MGWSSCGTDSKGRKIGYGHAGRCDHKDCNVKIDRGLGYACGGMHGENGWDCEGYFCGQHLTYAQDPDDNTGKQFCERCASSLEQQMIREFRDALIDFIRPVDDFTMTTMPLDASLVPSSQIKIANAKVGGETVGWIMVDKDGPTIPYFFFRHANGQDDVPLEPRSDADMMARIADLFDLRLQPLTAAEQKQIVYDLLIRWDEADGLAPDRDCMTEEVFTRAVAVLAMREESRSYAT